MADLDQCKIGRWVELRKDLFFESRPTGEILKDMRDLEMLMTEAELTQAKINFQGFDIRMKSTNIW